MINAGRPTKIKICGLTNLDDARCAARAGADLLGFVFYPPSPRFVTPEQVWAITRAIRAEMGATVPGFVGVFVGESAKFVQGVVDNAGLDLAQLHGDESPATVRSLFPHAFKAIRPRSQADAEAGLTAYADVAPDDTSLPQLLVDAYDPHRFGGTGIPAELSAAQSLARRCRLLLAGGLTPQTVGLAIKQVRPWGVDVSSGVERAKGLKDHALVMAFVEAVRAADATARCGP